MNAAQEHTAQGHHVGGNSSCRSTDEIVVDLVNGTDRDGGATVTVLASRPVPASGYVVAVPGHELRVKIDGGVFRELRAYVERKRGVVAGAPVSRPRFYGTWVDGTDVVLDVVEVFSDRAQAVVAGQDRGELAIWDLSAGGEIRTS